MDFEADKMVNLLQYCCWKARCTMDKNGFKELARKIGESSEHAKHVPDSRYLTDLLVAGSDAMQQNNFIGKKDFYINSILRYAGFEHWQDWRHSLSLPQEYIEAELPDLSSFSALEMTVCFPKDLESRILPHLSSIKRSTAYTLNLLSCKADDTATNLDFVLKALETSPFLIWAIPVSWKEQLLVLKAPGWEELIASRRIIPVWIEQDLWGKTPFISWLNHQQTIGNLPGLLISLLYLQEAVRKYHQPADTGKAASTTAGKIQNLQHNKGTFFLGDVQIKGEHLAMGDIHQTIHNHKNNEQ